MKRKWAFAIAIVAVVGAVFWLRELASWRPHTVAKVGFSSEQLEISRDGEWLLAQNIERGDGAVLDLEHAVIDTTSKSIYNFDKVHSSETFPRVWADFDTLKLSFSPTPTQKTPLSGVGLQSGMSFYNKRALAFPTGWSKERGEVYCAIRGVIWICDWNTGKLKKRVRYAKTGADEAVFSPDGKLLLKAEEGLKNQWFLRLYDVQTGRILKFLALDSPLSRFGYSPDGTSIWLTQASERGTIWNFNVVRLTDFKRMWSAACSGPAKWLPDGRIGIVQNDGFSFRNAAGREIARLPGPLHPKNLTHPLRNITDWAISPDGLSIYSAEASGVIRRWRAK